MINCWKCKLDKDESCFSWKNKAKGVRHKLCKSCKSTYGKTNYQDNKAKWLLRTRRNTARYRSLVRDHIWQYLTEHPCECGENDPIVLEFDHLGDKEFTISHALQLGFSLKKVQREIAKCVVRCANCHRRKTAKDRGWWQDKLDECVIVLVDAN